MLKNFLKVIAGDPNKKDIERYAKIAADINSLEPDFRALSDEQLRAKTAEYKARLAAELDGLTDPKEIKEITQAALDEILPEAFALVREAAVRKIGLRPFDVQLIGGMVMHDGKIAEMRTGEGKTLVATLPTYLNALTGRGVHVITVNDYLARRDARWMAPVYHALGLSVGVLQEAARTEHGKKAFVVDFEREAAQEDQHHLRLVDRQEAYTADVVYGTNNEFGFDYLRDNMALRLDDRVQRERYYAIVDEVDNILVDEARTPLIISGPSQEDPRLYYQIAKIVKQLKPEDYEIDERGRSIALTEVGEARLEKLLGQPLRDPDRPEEVTPDQARLLGHIEQALRAEFVFKRNKDYLVQSGKVLIIDEFTGRMMIGRRWSDGLHQAVEAKEGVEVQQDNVTYATITLQNYFRLYAKLAGMTGTALTEAEEFDKIYGLAVVAIPTNLEYLATRQDSGLIEAELKEEGLRFKYFARADDPEKTPVLWRRKDYPDLVYRTEEAKLRAITVETLRRHLHGQPLLIGTTSVDLSERLAERLRPEPLQRLALVLLIRDAWFEKNKKEEDGMLVPELAPLGAPLDSLNRNELGKQLKEFGFSTNPAGDENAARLVRILGGPEGSEATLIRTLQGGLKPAVLNAKKHDEESQIIAGAGARGAIMIATNMAGRGVDIKLGGEMAEEVLMVVNRVLRQAGHPDPYDLTQEQRREALLQIPEAEWGIYDSECRLFLQMMDDAALVKEVGGLHVIGSERHEARRIDNQLRGRAARQGDPGSSQFFLSLEDELMRRFGGQGVSDLMQRLNIDDSVPIQAGLVNRVIESSQTRVEGANFDIRKHLLEYDDVLNTQRNAIYTQRDRVFAKDDLNDDFDEMLTAEVERRTELAADDDEGRWRLMAWCDEVQPSLPMGDGELYPSYLLEILLRELDGVADPAAAIVALAGDALTAERKHLLAAIEQQIERSAERLDEQVRERQRVADEALEALENEANEKGGQVEARPAYRAVGDALGLSLQPSSDEARNFDLGRFRKRIGGWAEAAVAARTRAGLITAIERRIGTGLGLSQSVNDDLDWDAMSQALIEAAEQAHQERARKALEEIERELKANLPASPTRSQLTGALINVAWGRSTGFDQRTHRKVEVRTQRLTYAYLAGEMIADWETKELREEIVAHLRQAADVLRRVWGEAEFRRLAGTPAADLPPPTHAALGAAAGPSLDAAPTLGDLTGDARAAAIATLGRRLLTEVYRQLMLQVIGGLWVDYLTEIEAMRTSIGLEAYAQRDPLVAYKTKAFEMFKVLLANMRAGVIQRAFTVVPRSVAEAAGRAAQDREANGRAVSPAPAVAIVEREPAAVGAAPAQTGGGKRRRRRRRG